MPADKFGLPFLYPTKATGGLGTGPPFFYQQSNDIRNDDEIKGMVERSGGAGISDVNTSTGEFTANHESSDSWTINKDPSFTTSIGGNDMDFEDTENRGYGYKADQPRDIELKLLAKFIDSDDDTGWSMSGPTGRHQTPEPGCQGFAYMFSVEKPNDSPQRFRFRKEMWHVNYDNDPKTGSWTHSKVPFAVTDVDRYIGLCYVRYNKKDGRGSGKDSVIVEGWVNPDPAADKNNWIMMKRTEDTGGWGDGGDACDGEDDQVGTWSNAVFRIKASDMTIRYKNVTLREIDPTKTFDEPTPTPTPGEEPPSTQTIKGNFKLQWDLNTSRISACAGAGGGGGGGTSIFYSNGPDIDKELSDSSTHGNRTRVGQTITNSGSPMSGKIIKQVDVWLKKVGTPGASPVINVKIYNASHTLLYTSPTNIDPTTLTTSFAKYTFDLSSNTRTMVTGDKVVVEYTGTSSSNYVKCSHTEPSTISGCRYISYDGNWTDVGTREFSCDMWE